MKGIYIEGSAEFNENQSLIKIKFKIIVFLKKI